MPIRWGIFGAGKIASDFTTSLQYLDDVKVVAVAARSLEKANEFGDKFNIPKRYGKYEELVKDPDVDVIYVSTIHPEHHSNTLLCVQNGKNVLCEKPFTINAKQAKEVIQAAKQTNVFLMEAMWTRFFPAIIKAKELITSGEIGELQSITSSFGFQDTKTPRLIEPELGGGALLDIGVYQVSLASFFFGKATHISVTGKKHETGVDVELNSVLKYGEKTATFHTSFLEALKNEFHITGSKGSIELNPPFWSTSTIVLRKNDKNSEEQFHFPLPEEKPGHKFIFPNGIGMQFEAKHVVELLKSGKKESPIISLEETLSIMETMDEMRKILGVKYPRE